MNLNKKMITTILLTLTATILLFGCKTQTLEEASASYKKNGDIKSIETLYKHLKKGMTKTEVQKLLGESAAYPSEGNTLIYITNERIQPGDSFYLLGIEFDQNNQITEFGMDTADE